MQKVLLLGSDGYIGTALVQRLLLEGYEVCGVDNEQRRKAVKELNSFSAIPIKSCNEKVKLLKKIGNYSFFKFDITNYDKLRDVFRLFKPDVIVNLAHQPSAPYSQIDYNHALFTTTNNIIGTLNVLYCMKEISPEAHLVQIGTTGEYNPNINTDIPEGIFQFEFNGRTSNTCIFPRQAGSLYHWTKICSTYGIEMASRFWNLSCTDIMQGVVYGNWTPEIEETGIYTRFDSDEAHGTLVNRLIIQTILNIPLTLYGKGLHKRGFLAINDSVQCLMLAIQNVPDKGTYRTWNQLDETFSINDVADKVMLTGKKFGIDGEKRYIESPRVECLDDHYYNPIVKKLPSLGFKQTRTIEDETEYVMKLLLPMKDKIEDLRNVVLPEITWW